MGMRPNVRLLVCALIIMGSALYAVLCDRDANLASAVALGYVAILLTMFGLTQLWKRP